MWNMTCDIMPTICEDSISSRNLSYSGDEANFEQLMVNMLDERDKLVETLRETQEQLNETQNKLTDVNKEKESLQRQLTSTMPQLQKRILITKSQIFERRRGYKLKVSIPHIFLSCNLCKLK
uniref:Liprin-alpha n=1 Tax=Strigamia maritima TaxID=126957 RepID=T1JI83_STRMM